MSEIKEKSTQFQGAVSLDAILAAKTAKNKGVENNIPNVKVKEEPTESITTPVPEDLQPVEIPPVVPKPIETTTEKNPYYNKVLELISLGLLEDFTIKTSEEDETGTLISEFKDITEENLKEIIDISKKEKDNNISKNYISKEGLREHELKVIEILKNGGDLSAIANSEKEALERPFEGFDMEDQDRQIDVRYTDLVHKRGLDHEAAITVIKEEVNSGKIKAIADQIFNAYRKQHADYIDEIHKKTLKAKEIKELNFKENKKLLTSKLKEAGLKETAYKKISEEFSKKNEKGELFLVEKLREALDNPAENFELIMHLADKNIFNDVFKIKAAQESHKQIVMLATGAGKKGNKTTTNTRREEEEISPWAAANRQFNESIKR